MSDSLNSHRVFDLAITEHLEVIQELSGQRHLLETVATRMSEALMSGRKILWCGNGGSAADAQHLSAELVGRFRRERRGLASMALSTNTSILTAIGNDYGYEHVFRRQIEALCVAGDVVVGISTSGNSPNICSALQAGREQGAFTVAFTGATGGAAATIAEATVRIASRDTARIQEGHILCGHMICDWIEQAVCPLHAAAGEAVCQPS
jgi:D-sedoheptulose 7-phosphate isomerase